MWSKEALETLTIRAYKESPWHSLLSALKDLSESAFFHAPATHRGFDWMDGSVRDIVYHVTGDKHVQLSAAFGGGVENWTTVAQSHSKHDMETMLVQLQAAHELQLRHLRELPCEQLASQVSTWGGKRMRAHDLFLMLIEHDYYHAGQIRYIRNVVE